MQRLRKSLFAVIPAFTFLFLFTFCADEEVVVPTATSADSVKVSAASTTPPACSTCKYVVPANVMVVDAKLLGIQPGDMICFSSAIKYTTSITLKNVVGTADKPVIISNCGGTAVLTVTERPWNVKMSYSKFFRFTGGNVDGTYGIKISGSTSNGLVLCDLSTNFEVDHVEVSNVGFAGIMAKTDPTCDNATNRGYFTMRNISIHHNYVHHTGGEGLYVGHTFYGGYNLSCGMKLPHTIEGSKIYNNKVTYTGWDAIQVSSATKDANIYNNTVENFGTKMKSAQDYGIILGAGTGGRCYGNYVKGGTGTSLCVFGLTSNMIYNNLIVNSAKTGIFCDERVDVYGTGYKVMNNTIINPKEVGIRMYADKVPSNVVINNIVVNPGLYGQHGVHSFIMTLYWMKNTTIANNYTTRNIADVKFVGPTTFNYRLQSTSPAVNKGRSVSSYGIPTDFYGGARLKGSYVDIGVAEY